jgi:hypothetical protein
MEQTTYTLEELADITGMSPRHLSRNDGPLDRVADTYYWDADIVSSDRKTCTEKGLECLKDYLSQCGKKGEGVTYSDWQRSIWEVYNRADAIEPQGFLVPTPKVDIISPDAAISSLGDSVNSFNAAINSFDAYFDAIGEQIGNRAVTRVAVATKKSIDDGLAQMLNNIGKIGA